VLIVQRCDCELYHLCKEMIESVVSIVVRLVLLTLVICVKSWVSTIPKHTWHVFFIVFFFKVMCISEIKRIVTY